MKMFSVRAVAMMMTCGPLMACGEGAPNEAIEPLESVAHAVGNGSSSSPSEFTNIARVATVGSLCTGILISPAFVLTANHCITGAVNDCSPIADSDPVSLVNGSADIVFSHDLSGPSLLERQHTFATSGPIRVRISDPIDSCSELDAARDLALIQLNTRVPQALIPPLHPPLAGEPPCSDAVDIDDFTGTLVGYGGTDLLLADPATAVRNSNTSSGWERSDANSSGSERVLYNYWLVPAVVNPPTFWYNGPLKGDSGGPLLAAGRICGVNSRYFPDAVLQFPFPNPQPAIGADLADIESSGNLDFLAANILDAKGRFWGECDEGPVALRDVDSDDDLIPDACDICPNAAVHDAEGRNNYDLTGGQDSDGDLVPDACDTCPTAYDPAQADVDGDGLGNACDTCPSSNLTGLGDLSCCVTDFDCFGLLNVCVPGPGAPGNAEGCDSRCALANDTDWDNVGQNCDNCPSLFNNQVDKDADGVGDACDNCRGTALGAQPADANPECGSSPVPDAFCQTLHPEGECTPLAAIGGGVEPRRCTRFADDDDDDVGDGCDSCPGLYNPAWSAGNLQPNCNILAERITGMQDYPFTGDVCDPIPCAELDVTIPEPIVLCPQGGCTDPFEPTIIPEAIRAVRFSPQLLPPGSPGAFANTGVPAATAGLRWCMCTEQSGPGEDCGCPVSGAHYEDSGVWHVPLTYLGGYGTEFPVDPDDLVPPEFSDLEMVDPRIVPIPAFGFAPRDTNTFKANWIPEVVGPLRLSLWSNVVAVPQIPNSPFDYRPTASHYHVGYFGTPIDFDVGQNEIAIGLAPPFDSPVCLNCPHLIDEPNWVVNPSQQRLFAASLGRAEEMTGVLTADVLAAVVDPTLTWIAASEPRGRLSELDLRAVAIDGSTEEVVVGIAPRGFVVADVIGERLPEPRDTAPMSDAIVAAVLAEPREHYGVVVSGSLGMVFLVGGRAVGADYDGVLRVYDVLRDEWSEPPLDGPIPGHVLASTYRADDQSLYLIDEVIKKVGPLSLKKARLLRIDLRTRTTFVLGSWPRSPLMKRVFLSVGPRGQLVLAGARPQPPRFYAGVVIDVGPAGGLQVSAAFAGPGALLFAPRLTELSLTLPIQDGPAANRVKSGFLPVGSLFKLPLHGIGTCL